MSNPRQVMGVAIIRVNGKVYRTDGKSTLVLGGVKRDHVEADHAAGYFSAMPAPSELTSKLLMTADVSTDEINSWDNATYSFEADTGQSYVVEGAFSMEPPSISDGKCDIKLGGPPAEQVTV